MLDSAEAPCCTELIARAFSQGAGLHTPIGAVSVQGRVVMSIEELINAPWLMPVSGTAQD